jgi:hypothetical protein
MIKPSIVIFSPSASDIVRMKGGFGPLPYVLFFQGSGTYAGKRASLDAMWVSPMMAVEYCSVNPPFPLHKAMVLETPQSQITRGIARYLVAGVELSADDPKTPQFEIGMITTSMLTAIRQFNSSHDSPIVRIGMLPEYLGLGILPPEEAAKILDHSYSEVFGSG